jgi:hypothetical protein
MQRSTQQGVQSASTVQCLNCTNDCHMCSYGALGIVSGANGFTWAVTVVDNDQNVKKRKGKKERKSPPGSCTFRVSFEGVPVFLCTFHVLQAWLKNIRCKLSNKARAKEAFNAVYSILYLRAVGTSEDRAAAVEQAMCAFRAAFASGALTAYFDNTWTAKWSAPLLQSQLCQAFSQLRPGTCLILHPIHSSWCTPHRTAAKWGP